MRILHLYKGYPPPPGGIENTIQLLARGQAAAGHEVTVLVSAAGARPRRETVDGVTILRLARVAKLASTPLSPTLGAQVARHTRGVDIAHVHTPFPPAELANLLFGRARRTVITWHSDVVRQRRILKLYAPLLRRVVEKADRIFPTSAAYLESSPWLQAAGDRCQVIPLGIDLDRFLRDDPDRDARARVLRTRVAPEPAFLILYVGRLVGYKGLPVLVDAMRQIDARLIIAGDGPDGPTLEARARTAGVADKIHFAGRVADADLPAWYRAADCFVLPSVQRSEAFGLVLVEAMASGLPVISTELGTGTSQVNQSEKTGLVVPPSDPAALAGAIRTLISDGARRERYSNEARARAKREYAAEVYLARTEQAYRDVL